MFAAGSGHSQIVMVLLDRGANMSVVDEEGRAALHRSAFSGHVDATKLLVKAGSDLEANILHRLQASHRLIWLRNKGTRRS